MNTGGGYHGASADGELLRWWCSWPFATVGVLFLFQPSGDRSLCFDFCLVKCQNTFL